MRKRATPSFVFIAPLVLLIMLSVYIRATYSPEPVLLQIDMARTFSAGEDGALILDATLRLANNAEEFVELSANGECQILRWYIVDSSDQIIQSQRTPVCEPNEVLESIDAESALVYSTRFALDPSRFAPGERYFLRVRFWGYEAQERFTVSD